MIIIEDGYGIFFGVVIAIIAVLFMYVLVEPLIKIGEYSAAFTVLNITEMRIFVFFGGLIGVLVSVLLPLATLGFILSLLPYDWERRLTIILFLLLFISFYVADYILTDNNMLVEFFIAVFNWLFGSVSS